MTLAWRKKVRNAERKLLVCKPAMKNCIWLKRKKINAFIYKFFLRAYDLKDKPDKFQLYWECIFNISLPWGQVKNLNYIAVVEVTILPMKNFIQNTADYKNAFWLGYRREWKLLFL